MAAKKAKPKFRTEMEVARVAGEFGFRSMSRAEASDRGNEVMGFRRLDSGNVARCATALERIARYLGRLAKVAEAKDRGE